MTNALVPSSGHLAKPSADKQWRRLLEEDIGLDNVEEALEFATLDEPEDANKLPSKYKVMLRRMADPALGLSKNKNGDFRNSITHIMKECGVSKVEMLSIVQKRDQALALLNSSRHVYAMLDDMGEDARSRVVDCQKCGGEGVLIDKDNEGVGFPDEGEPAISGTKPCGQCDGVGKVRKIGDPQSRRMLAEIHGLIQGKGTNISTNVGVGVKVNVDNSNKPESKQADITTRVQKYLDAEVVK